MTVRQHAQQGANMPGIVGSSDTGAEVSIEGVGHAFLHGRNVVRAVWDFDLHVPACQFVSVIGPSGCGKTTILGMMAGIYRPSVGSVSADGQQVAGARPDVAYMLARDALLPWRSARANVELGLEVNGVKRERRHEIATEWLARVGLADFGDSSVAKLSQGMRQRVAIARTLALDPRLILMDEPFAALDAQTRVLQQQSFLRLWGETRPTVILVTHDLVEAIRLSDRVVLVSHRPGKVIEDVQIDLPRPRKSTGDFSIPAFREYHEFLGKRLSREVESAMHSLETGD